MTDSRTAFDIFNGDADGICALHQLRLAEPREATLLTGTKREIDLVARVPQGVAADLTVLDVSFDTNCDAIRRVLEEGGSVRHFDHHSARKLFQHARLDAHIDESPQVCTSIIVDRHLQGRFRLWAATAAFGDNLREAGLSLASAMGLDASDTRALEQLGFLINYNAYGERVEDLHVAPETLYRSLHAFTDPRDFVRESPAYECMANGYREDAEHIENHRAAWDAEHAAVYMLPCEPWARRVSGVLANRLVNTHAHKSFAVLTAASDGHYVVSVRSAMPDTHSASGLCSQFESGGGRGAAGGINRLPANEVDRFIDRFSSYFMSDRDVVPQATHGRH